MRGYTFDPALLVLKSEQPRLQSVTSEQAERPSISAKQTPAQEEIRSRTVESKAPVQLNAVSSNRIDGGTAWTIAGVLLLAVFVAALVAARARLTRLETLLFAMLSHQHQAK